MLFSFFVIHMNAIFHQDPDLDPFFISAGSGSVEYQPGSATLVCTIHILSQFWDFCLEYSTAYLT